jgi:hypothetical protein
MKSIIGVVSVSLAMTTGSMAIAQTETHSGMDTLAQGSWEQMTSLEPCMNGAVSASGLYPSQIIENMSFSSRGVMASAPPR